MRKIALLLVAMLPLMAMTAKKKVTNSSEARQIFEATYNKVFGDQGCTLHYDVNLVGIYKTNGTIWIKGKKSKFSDSKVDSWNDGQTVYIVHRKKKHIDIFDANSEKRDKYASKFKFTLDDFDYEIMERVGGYVLLKLKQRKGAKGTVKEARAVIEEKTLKPIQVRVKVALFWANITISDFSTEGITDDIFVFPKTKYGSEYKYEDKRDDR